MRESLCGSRIETHGAKELLDPAACLTGALSDPVELQWLAQNLRDLHSRIERRIRVLEHHLHLASKWSYRFI